MTTQVTHRRRLATASRGHEPSVCTALTVALTLAFSAVSVEREP